MSQVGYDRITCVVMSLSQVVAAHRVFADSLSLSLSLSIRLFPSARLSWLTRPLYALQHG